MTKAKTHRGMKLKKFLSVLCLTCLLFSCASVTAMAADKGKIEGSSSTALRGETVELSLELKDNPGIWATKIKVKYNDSALTLKSVQAGSVFDGSELTFSKTLDKNPYVIVATGNAVKNKTADGKIVTLKFAVSSDAAYKDYPIKVDVIQTISAAGKDVKMDAADGKITVKKEEVTPPTDGDEDKPTDGDGDKPTDGEGDKPTDGGGDKPTDGDGDKPTDGDGDKPTDGDGDKPTDGDGDKPTDGGADDPTDDDSNLPTDDEGNNAAGSDDDADGNTDEDADTDADKDDSADGDSSAKTGDNGVIMPLVLMLAAAAVCVVMMKRRRS